MVASGTPSSTPSTPSHPGGDATMVTEEELLTDHCCTCRKPVTAENSLTIVRATSKARPEVKRCRSCHNVRSALARLSKNTGNLVCDFNNMDGDRLQAFYTSHAHLRGDELKSKVEELVSDWKTATTKFEFNVEGEYLDEDDLNQKYSAKPEMLRNILQNAPRHFCPVKKIYLYADPKYTSKIQDATEYGTQQKRKGAMVLKDDEAPNKKKGGGKGGGKEKQEPGEEEVPKIKAGEKKKMQKKTEQTNAKYLQLKDLVSKCASYGNMIPPYVLDHANKTIGSADEVIANTQKTLDEGKGDSGSLQKALDEIFDQVGTAIVRVKAQVDQAAQFKS